jgi:LacI family transcriptional regulator
MKTIKDVAKLAGVSPATVSRAINNSDQVSESAKSKIQKAIVELDFRPNASARALVNQSTRTIGVVISELADPFFAKMAKSIEFTAKKLGYKVIISTGSLDAKKELQAIHSLQSQRCDAFVVNSKALSDEALIQQANNLPGLVLINKFIPAIANRCVWFDNVKGGFIMGDYIASMGHKNLVVLSTQDKVHDASRRLKGIKQALADHKIKIKLEHISYGTPDYTGGKQAIKMLVDKKACFSAILCYNDAMATGAISYLIDAGYKIPEQVSIIGFDDVLLAEYCVPKLTTIKYPIETMAKKATELALSLIHTEASTAQPTGSFKYSPFLVNRNSVAKP